MKNNEKLRECKMSASIESDQTFRITYDNYDFIGFHGFRRRDWKRLFLTKKHDLKSKLFMHDTSWVLLTDKGCISFWDGVTQGQLRLDALSNPDTYETMMGQQQLANDVYYYAKAGINHLNKLVQGDKKFDAKDLILPALFAGAMILTAVLNLYAVSNIPAVLQTAHATSGGVYSLGNYFSHIAGVP